VNRPLGITIIAIVLAISGVLDIVLGLVGMDILPIDVGELASGSDLSGGAAVITGILTLIVSYGMWMTAGWAWLLTVAVMIFRIVVDVWAIVTHGIGSPLGSAAIGQLIVSAIILWYFFRPNVRAAFER
jgi:lysylphosphatidylglycerol synthetase-like protein (DUF2156 family)